MPEGNTKKLHRPWKPGYRVIKVTSPLNYLIEHPDRRGRILRVHVERLKAAVPEMVWPQDTGADDNSKPTHKGSVTALDRWLQHETNRYKPFQPDGMWEWEDTDEEEADPNLSTSVQLGGLVNPQPFSLLTSQLSGRAQPEGENAAAANSRIEPPGTSRDPSTG